MLQEDVIPCAQCKSGLHRTCHRPVAIPTLLAYVDRRRKAPSETMMCCDRKEFWTVSIFD